jgi:LuxR family maltose regulon positive regulatory protein
MPVPVLTTKLYIPPPRPNAVPRPRLLARLNEERKLILISAPAGFGKTTLVSEWINQKAEGGRMKDESNAAAFRPSSLILHPFKVAWLSLDEDDSDLARFLVYFVAALQTIAPNVGEGVLSALQAEPPTDALLRANIINRLAVPWNLLGFCSHRRAPPKSRYSMKTGEKTRSLTRAFNIIAPPIGRRQSRLACVPM